MSQPSTNVPQPPRRPAWQRPAVWIIVGFSWVAVVLLVTGLIFFTRPMPGNTLPAGWLNISAPQHGSLAFYAVNPTVPGTAVALIATPSSGAQMTLWRTADGGDSWRQVQSSITFPGYTMLTYVRGGNQLYAYMVANATPAVYVSHDDGTTWRQVLDISQAYVTKELFAQLSRSSYVRNGKLYAQVFNLPTSGPNSSHFSVSEDDGATWTALEQGDDALPNYLETPIAPDLQNPQGWYRLGQIGSQMRLEHSLDDGRSWLVVGSLQSPGVEEPLAATVADLAIDPQQPQTLCAALQVQGQPGQNGSNFDHLLLLHSADGGTSWTSAPIGIGYFASETGPVVAPGADGACLAATNSTQNPTSATLWRLGAGDTTTSTVASLPSQRAAYFAPMQRGSQLGIALLIVTSPPSTTCNVFCLPFAGSGGTIDYRLIWHDAA